MQFYWKLLVLVLLAVPTVSFVGCGPSRASSDVTPDNTGDDGTTEDDEAPGASESEGS